VQDVPYEALREKLEAAKQVIRPLPVASSSSG
jgi:hypothetical protein